MIILDTINRALEVDLTGAVATNQLPFVASYVDINQSLFAMSAASTNTGTTNSTTAVTLVAAPGAATSRQLKYLSIKNSDTAPVELWVQVNDNATLREIWKGTLAVGDALVYLDRAGWTVIDSTGHVKTTGGVNGPGSSTDNAIARWNGTGGTSIQDTSNATISDAGQLALTVAGSAGGILVGGDVQWYRDSANVWRTPDAVIIDSSLTANGTGAVGVFSSSNNGNTNDIQIKNTSNTAGSDARIFAQTGGTSGGDAYMGFYDGSTLHSIGKPSGSTTIIIGSNAPTGGTPYLSINASVVTVAGNLTVSGTGPHAIGTAASADRGMNYGTFTTPGLNTSGYGVLWGPTLVEHSSGTHPVMAGAYFDLSMTAGAAATTNAIVCYIPANFTAPSGTVNASGLKLLGVPTGATNNYAFWSASTTAGAVRIDGGTTGAQTATFTATNKPGSGTTSPDTWLPITIDGTLHYIPAFL